MSGRASAQATRDVMIRRLRPVRDAAALDVAASDRKAVLSGFERRDHYREDVDVVAEVGVHRAQRLRLRTRKRPPIDHAARKSELAWTMQTPDRKFGGEAIDDGAGAVGRIVVDDDDLAVKVVRFEHIAHRAQQTLDAAGFVVGWNDDGKREFGHSLARAHTTG